MNPTSFYRSYIFCSFSLSLSSFERTNLILLISAFVSFNLQVILDVQQFSPDEITVKTVEKNVVVEAKHEERQDEHGFISRHFVRRYVLPTDYDAINVTSTLSSDGVLTITAPRKVNSFSLSAATFPPAPPRSYRKANPKL